MKTMNLIQVSFLAVAVMTIGCAQKKSSSTTSPVTVIVNDPTTGIPTPGSGSESVSSGEFPNNGATSGLGGVYMTDLNTLVAKHSINAPSEVKVFFNLKQITGDYPYAGRIKIGYRDNGKWNVMEFIANSGLNEHAYNLGHGGTPSAKYNRWFLLNNQKVFSGFFEGQYASIVITVDKAQSQGDGQGEQYLSGTVWYKMYAQSYAVHPAYRTTVRQCWFITVGPYACYSDTIVNKTSLTPSNGYKKLGTFKGINKSVAFKR